MSRHQSTSHEAPVLAVRELRKEFVVRRNLLGRPTDTVAAVQEVSFDLFSGRTLAVVGESGSGKSTTARLIARLLSADTGTVVVDGVEWTALSERRLRPHRRALQMVFQDPYSSLDPTKMIVDSIGEPLITHERIRRRELDRRVIELLELVGLSPRHLHRYPHEFSGGQRQRISLARALAADPQVLVADEAVSALDVSTQAQILNLLRDIQRERGTAILFITHDLSVVRQVADDVLVMRMGRVVERGPADVVLRTPTDEYTRSLLASVPEVSAARRAERASMLADSPIHSQA